MKEARDDQEKKTQIEDAYKNNIADKLVDTDAYLLGGDKAFKKQTSHFRDQVFANQGSPNTLMVKQTKAEFKESTSFFN